MNSIMKRIRALFLAYGFRHTGRDILKHSAMHWDFDKASLRPEENRILRTIANLSLVGKRITVTVRHTLILTDTPTELSIPAVWEWDSAECEEGETIESLLPLLSALLREVASYKGD